MTLDKLTKITQFAAVDIEVVGRCRSQEYFWSISSVAPASRCYFRFDGGVEPGGPGGGSGGDGAG